MMNSLPDRIGSRLRGVLLPTLVAALLTAAPGRAQQETAPEVAGGGAIEVQVSFFLMDVLRILDAEQTVEADLFYRLEWHDERLASEEGEPRTLALDSIWHPALLPLAPRGLTDFMPEVVLVDKLGNVSYTQRVIGMFGASTNLRDFPLDEHDVELAFAIPNMRDTELELVPGPILGRSEELTIPDWTLSEEALDLTPVMIVESLPPIPAASLKVRAKRNLAHYLTKMILPLIVIVMISWTVFWTPPPQIGVQFGFAATSILTVIAYRFALSSQLPRVPYSTRLDSFLNGAFIMVALALVEVVVTAQLLYRDKPDTAQKVDVTCRAAFPVLLVLILVYSFLV